MITGHTRLAAVIGDPVAHSLSPRLLNAAFEAAGLDWTYVAFRVAAGDAAQAVSAMSTLDIGGLSVTMPHKTAIVDALPNLTPAAASLGAVNCVYWSDGELWGDSTDGDGLVDAVNMQFDNSFVSNADDPKEPPLDGAAFNEKVVVVLGTGGAARSIVEAIGRRTKANLIVAGRSSEAVSVTSRLAPTSVGIELAQITDLDNIDVLINATSVGMHGGEASGKSPILPEVLGSHQTVIDIVYQPRVTPLLSAASALGAQTMNGVPMLVHQAARAFQHWTGHVASVDSMTATVASELAD